MVAAMHIQTENDKTAFGLRTTDLRNIAIGFAAAILLVMVAGQMSDSGSASVLDETAEKRFADPTIGIAVIAGNDGVNYDEYNTDGFTVTGMSSNTADDCAEGAACTVTVNYGGVERSAAVASDESWSVSFSAAQLAAGNTGNGVDDATDIAVTASVTNLDDTATVSTSVEQDSDKPGMVITSNTVVSGADTSTGAIVLIYTSDEATSNFALVDITVTECVNAAFTTQSTTIYGSTCTEDSNGVTPTVLVAVDKYTDTIGNDNTVSNTYTWTYDTADPTMTITSNTIASGGSTTTAAVVLI